ncbi:hypothetical protein [Zavarzinia sp.]|uniref:hypothetical protein n=1 Tax=Zavarzinia sp. TaxID=2027920 RepID=UPI003BB6FBA0|nr:hypothetical protein [Zavarzinia sp.]
MNTTPPGASCVFEREGAVIGTLPSTPASLSVSKTKYNITIRCDKPGYQQAVALSHSGTSAAIAANIALDVVLTLGVSSIVDSAVGADNKYDTPIVLNMVPIGGAPASVVPQLGAATDLTALLADKTLYITEGDSKVTVDYYGTDGKLTRKDGDCTRAGSWSAKDGQLCLGFSAKDETTKCYAVSGTATQPAFRDVNAAADAAPISTRFMAKGNIENLPGDTKACN